MGRFAQIQDERVHWIFEGDAPPPMAFQWYDLSGIEPPPKEGWIANEDGTYSPPPPPPRELKIAAETAQGSKPWFLTFARAGDFEPAHSHARDQIFWVVSGSVLIRETKERHAEFDVFTVKAGDVHTPEALEDNTQVCTRFV